MIQFKVLLYILFWKHLTALSLPIFDKKTVIDFDFSSKMIQVSEDMKNWFYLPVEITRVNERERAVAFLLKDFEIKAVSSLAKFRHNLYAIKSLPYLRVTNDMAKQSPMGARNMSKMKAMFHNNEMPPITSKPNSELKVDPFDLSGVVEIDPKLLTYEEPISDKGIQYESSKGTKIIIPNK